VSRGAELAAGGPVTGRGGMRKLAEVLERLHEGGGEMSAEPEPEAESCPDCGGAGYYHLPPLPDAQPWEMRLTRCQSCNPVPETVGIPPRFEGCTMETFDLTINPRMETAVKAAKAVACGKMWGAVLIGLYGTGKTHLAVAAMKASVHERPSLFWSVPRLLDFWRRAYEVEAFKIEYLMAPYLSGRFLLVLDDLGTEKMTEWAAERLYEVIDARYGGMLPTIVTSNIEVDRLDPRIVSRFGRAVVACVGRDVRMRKGGPSGSQGKGPGELR
jgi:DNA replication protein DnaC